MANENDGRVVCPKTQESYHVDQAEKVYVMWAVTENESVYGLW